MSGQYRGAIAVAVWLAAGRLSTVSGQAATAYTQNALCKQNNCVNPVFPGLLDLGRLESVQWQCSTRSETFQYMDFCRSAVNYDPALPSPTNASSTTVQSLVKAQDDAAATMYFYHLNGMGVDAWDHAYPDREFDDCTNAIYRMVCFTYFPRSEAGCSANQVTPYKRPCGSSCANYIQACSVECCDESVACVFSRVTPGPLGASLVQSGYVDASGPSALCTGGTMMRASAQVALLLVLVLHFAAGGWAC